MEDNNYGRHWNNSLNNSNTYEGTEHPNNIYYEEDAVREHDRFHHKIIDNNIFDVRKQFQNIEPEDNLIRSNNILSDRIESNINNRDLEHTQCLSNNYIGEYTYPCSRQNNNYRIEEENIKNIHLENGYDMRIGDRANNFNDFIDNMIGYKVPETGAKNDLFVKRDTVKFYNTFEEEGYTYMKSDIEKNLFSNSLFQQRPFKESIRHNDLQPLPFKTRHTLYNRNLSDINVEVSKFQAFYKLQKRKRLSTNVYNIQAANNSDYKTENSSSSISYILNTKKIAMENMSVLKQFIKVIDSIHVDNITVIELKQIMREFGINYNGKKSELIDRLIQMKREVMEIMPGDNANLVGGIENLMEENKKIDINENNINFDRFYF